MSVRLIFSCSPAMTIIHSRIAGTKKKRDMKAFFLPLFSVLISRCLARILSITIAHLFSFVSPLVSPFNPFSFPPSVPFTAAFISTQSLNLPQPLILHPSHPFQQLSDKLCLTSSTCLSSPFPFFQPSCDCCLSRLFLFCWHISSLYTHFRSVRRSLSTLSLYLHS